MDTFVYYWFIFSILVSLFYMYMFLFSMFHEPTVLDDL